MQPGSCWVSWMCVGSSWRMFSRSLSGTMMKPERVILLMRVREAVVSMFAYGILPLVLA